MKIVVDKEYLEDLINALVQAERADELGVTEPEAVEKVVRGLMDTRNALNNYLASAPTVKD
jgi:hypothetical protein